MINGPQAERVAPALKNSPPSRLSRSEWWEICHKVAYDRESGLGPAYLMEKYELSKQELRSMIRTIEGKKKGMRERANHIDLAQELRDRIPLALATIDEAMRDGKAYNQGKIAERYLVGVGVLKRADAEPAKTINNNFQQNVLILSQMSEEEREKILEQRRQSFLGAGSGPGAFGSIRLGAEEDSERTAVVGEELHTDV